MHAKGGQTLRGFATEPVQTELRIRVIWSDQVGEKRLDLADTGPNFSSFNLNGIRNSYKNHQTLFALGPEPVLWPMGSGSTQSGAGRGHSSCFNTHIRIANP